MPEEVGGGSFRTPGVELLLCLKPGLPNGTDTDFLRGMPQTVYINRAPHTRKIHAHIHNHSFTTPRSKLSILHLQDSEQWKKATFQ